MKKILFTGAHHNSALVVLDELNDLSKNKSEAMEFLWVGQKYTANRKLSPEYEEVTKRNVKFFNINAGKVYRTTSIRYLIPMLVNLILIPIGFISALVILLKSRPNLIVSFGGYVAVPLVIVGKFLGIRSITHEQTAVIGLANQVIFKFVDRIYVSWPLEYYADVNSKTKDKLRYIGLPLRKDFLDETTSSGRFSFEHDLPIIYVTGGKSGSRYINDLVLSSVADLLQEFNIIWSCGGTNYSAIAAELKKLSTDQQKQILLKEYFFEDEIKKVFNTSDIILTRGGAHTMYELAALRKLAIIIPIPWASNNEQYKNAQILVDANLAVVLNQETLTKEAFLMSVSDVKHKLNDKAIGSDVKSLVRFDAGQVLANDIFKKVTKT